MTITDASHLRENKFSIKVLFVPRGELLSESEKRVVDDMRARVFENTFTKGSTGCMHTNKKVILLRFCYCIFG